MPSIECLFLTGSTGLIGRTLLGFLKKHRPERSIVALIRQPEQVDPLRRQGVHTVLGDLTRPRLGMSPRDYSSLCENITDILHVAAEVRFDLSSEESRPVNVGGVEGILELARSCNSLRKLGHVSTTYVNGYREGVFAEEPMPPGQEFINGYQQSKFEAEQLVLGAMSDIPACIYRIPVVLADSADGVVSQFGYFHHLLRMLPGSSLPVMPGDPDLLVDMVPADWTAAALAYLFDFRFSSGAIRHLCAGGHNSMRFREVADVSCRIIERHSSNPPGRFVRLPRLVSIAEFDEFVRASTEVRMRRIVSLLGHHVRLMGVRQEYLNSKAQADLEDSGLALPEMRGFLTNTLNYCLDNNWGRKPLEIAAHAAYASD